MRWKKIRRNVYSSRRRDREDTNGTLPILHIVIFTVFEIMRIPTI
jgi:hypothetical protein